MRYIWCCVISLEKLCDHSQDKSLIKKCEENLRVKDFTLLWVKDGLSQSIQNSQDFSRIFQLNQWPSSSLYDFLSIVKNETRCSHYIRWTFLWKKNMNKKNRKRIQKVVSHAYTAENITQKESRSTVSYYSLKKSEQRSQKVINEILGYLLWRWDH